MIPVKRSVLTKRTVLITRTAMFHCHTRPNIARLLDDRFSGTNMCARWDKRADSDRTVITVSHRRTETVERPVIQPQPRRAAGLLLCAVRPGDVD